MRDLHGTPPSGRQSVMAGRNQLGNSLPESAVTRLHTFRVNSGSPGQRQPEVRGYCSQALFLVPTAGAIQTIITTVSVTVRDKMAMSTGFTSDSGLLEVDRVADQRAGHAVAAAAAAAELGADDGDDLDSRLTQQGIGAGVAVVGEHHAG